MHRKMKRERKGRKERKEREREWGARGRGERGGGKDRLATFPLVGDVEDAEDSLAWARCQGHLCPWLQEDGAPCMAPQEPVQVGGLVAHEEGQVQRVARRLQPGVQAQGAWDCKEAGDRGLLQQELVGPHAAKL